MTAQEYLRTKREPGFVPSFRLANIEAKASAKRKREIRKHNRTLHPVVCANLLHDRLLIPRNSRQVAGRRV